tara:strand:- start:486 stop:935 length:450 start_codon:yes stop_codon:yes gene_type:complete
MKIIIIIILFFTLSCSTNKVSQNHGYKALESKYDKIFINKTNKNDVVTIIGPPSTVSDFNENKWFYIERKKTNQSLIKLGIKKIEKNNILIVEFNQFGILKNKELIDLTKMNDVKYVKSITTKDFQNKNFFYNIFTSLREKINSPSKNK